MTVTVEIDSCSNCRHSDHSGGFTPGGALPVCGHHEACYGSYAKVPTGATVRDVLIQHGMSSKAADLYTARMEQYEADNILLAKHQPGDCYHWIHRVTSKDIPEWCPLKHGGKY